MTEEINNEVIIYESTDGQSTFEVNLKEETVWLTQKQMAELFGKTTPTINEHIKNIYKEQELQRDSTIRKFRIVQKEGSREVEREVECYNLDVVISVGYRVKSKEGTQFRIWATNVLKQHLVQGYSLNEKKLREQAQKLSELQQAIKLLSNVIENQSLDSEQATGLLKVITDYTYALGVLDDYDHQRLIIDHTSPDELYEIKYEEAMIAVHGLKERFDESTIFGVERDDMFQSSIHTVYQSFGGQDLYPSVEEKAANLLYLVIKNHPFVDGNKRIAAFMFVWFLERNQLLYRENGSRLLADNALVALTLMIAQSDPKEKDIMTKLIVNLINQKN